MQELKINIPVYGWTIRKKTNAINCGHENLLRHFFFFTVSNKCLPWSEHFEWSYCNMALYGDPKWLGYGDKQI